MGLIGMACNFGGMILLPMAAATSINLSVPSFAVLFAALLLGERTGWQRCSAVTVGFVGVLIMLAPGARVAGGIGGHHGLGIIRALGGGNMSAAIRIGSLRDRVRLDVENLG